ncbi:Protein TRM32 [Linum perenne]
MGKRSQRGSQVQCEKPGCMWNIMSILDFRYGRITQKLLLDRRFESRNRVGSQKQKSMHNTTMNVDEINQETSDGEENVEITRRPSVKDLIEEDLLNEQLSKSDTYCAASELPCSHDSDELMCNGDIGRTMDEFLCHERNRSRAKNDHESPELEEKLKEILTLFVSQRLADRKHQEEDNDGVVHHSQELRDALRKVSSDEELVLQFLQGQKSFLGKFFENSRNSQVRNDEQSPVHVAEQELCDSKQANELSAATTKQRKFFRRRSKSLEKTVPKGKNSPQATNTNRIVILKPGLQNLETRSGLDSSPQSEMTMTNKGGIERSSSHFSLTEIKRRLKNAMGRERQEGSKSIDRNAKRYPVDSSNNRLRESNGTSSPGKEHFFTEIIARRPNASKPVECDKGKELQEVSNIPKRRESNIYTQAKKHLSEILTNYPRGEMYPKTWNSKPLGRILSFPECNSPSSSLNDFWYGFVPARMSLPNIEKLQRLESNVGRISLCSELSDDNSSVNKAQVTLDPSNSTLQELSLPLSDLASSIPDQSVPEVTTEDEVGIEKPSEITVSKEIDIVDDTCETSSCPDSIDHETGDSCRVHEERSEIELLDHESSPSKRCHDLESKDLLGRPSPVSVLDQIFVEEDISPEATRYQSFQPRRIQFEDADSLDSDEEPHSKSGAESSKYCIFEFIKTALLASGLNWEDFYLMSESPDQILDPSSCYELELFPNDLCCDKQLLFDCTDEALTEVYERYFSCSPGLSLAKPPIRPVPDMENTIYEVWRKVYWHLLPFPAPHSLEQIVTKDMDRDGSWMDIRRDTQTVIVEIGEAIFDDLIERSILGCCVDKMDDDHEGICI